MLVSPAVPLVFLGEGVLGLGTGEYSQAFLRCCPTTHSLWTGRKSGRNPLPAEATAGQLPVHSPPQAFMQEVEFSATGKAGQGNVIQVGFPGL